MPTRHRASQIRRFIVHAIEQHPTDIAKVTAAKFHITTQATNRHLRKLSDEGIIEAHGNTRGRSYKLTAKTVDLVLVLNEGLVEEHVVWREHVAPLLAGLPKNVIDICNHGFTEILNNAIDHSEGTVINITVAISAASVEFWIVDNGVGIFRKIKQAMNLGREADAVLELVKGKVTTDPSRHTGEGIFFTSRMFDTFSLLSRRLFFAHGVDMPNDWVVERTKEMPGTSANMTLDVSTERTTTEVFDRFAKPDEYTFSITHVPVALAQYGEENLVSRSQAKRLVNRFEKFEEVMLDFGNVSTIGQAFADEIFRVFQLAHPNVLLIPMNANSEVMRMVRRARSGLEPQVVKGE